MAVMVDTEVTAMEATATADGAILIMEDGACHSDGATADGAGAVDGAIPTTATDGVILITVVAIMAEVTITVAEAITTTQDQALTTQAAEASTMAAAETAAPAEMLMQMAEMQDTTAVVVPIA